MSMLKRLLTTVSRQVYDTNGNILKIEITNAASKQLHKILDQEKAYKFLRVSVEGGGCHGFQYKMKLEENLNSDDDVDGSKVVIDAGSLKLVNGSQLDYSSELIGSSFKIIGNPMAASGCGCGTSFDLK